MLPAVFIPAHQMPTEKKRRKTTPPAAKVIASLIVIIVFVVNWLAGLLIGILLSLIFILEQMTTRKENHQ